MHFVLAVTGYVRSQHRKTRMSVDSSAKANTSAISLKLHVKQHPLHHQLSWVRIRGYPTWPGLIVDESELTPLAKRAKVAASPGSIPVFFLGTYDYSWCSISDISEYSAHREKFVAEATGRKRPIAELSNAVAEADQGLEKALELLRYTLKENEKFNVRDSEEEDEDATMDEQGSDSKRLKHLKHKSDVHTPGKTAKKRRSLPVSATEEQSSVKVFHWSCHPFIHVFL